MSDQYGNNVDGEIWVPVRDPWPCYTRKQAARILGVDAAVMDSLRSAPRSRLRVFQSRTRAGNPVWLYNREDVEALKVQMGGDG